MPQPTGLNLIDSLEFGLYEEKLAEVRHYNEHITNTSLNEMRGVHLMANIKTAMIKAFAELYYGKVNMLDLPANVEENLLVFDSSDETKFSRPSDRPTVCQRADGLLKAGPQHAMCPLFR